MTDNSRPSPATTAGDGAAARGAAHATPHATGAGSSAGSGAGSARSGATSRPRRRRRRGHRPAGEANSGGGAPQNQKQKQQSRTGDSNKDRDQEKGKAKDKGEAKEKAKEYGKGHNSNAQGGSGKKRAAQRGKKRGRGRRPTSGRYRGDTPAKGGAQKKKQGGSRKAQQRRGGNPRGGHGDAIVATRDETSAGGLVVSGMAEAVTFNGRDGRPGSVDLSRIYVALIGRLDKRGRLLWSMPKGHVEAGEQQWETAQREVWEETGIRGEAFNELGVIDYWFVSDGVRIHKTVHHNLLRYVDGVLNDDDPEVTEVTWVPMSELIERLAYADERKLARIALNRMPDLARKEAQAGRATPR